MTTFKAILNFLRHRLKRWSQRKCPCYCPHPAAISVQLPLYEWTCTSDGRSITAGQGQQARDFPLNIKHSLYHDGNILRGFSSVQLTLRDFTFHRPHHVQTLKKKTLELSYSQRILLRIRLTGLTVSSLLCKLKYFFSIFSFKVIIQSGFGNRLISCRLNKFWP